MGECQGILPVTRFVIFGYDHSAGMSFAEPLCSQARGINSETMAAQEPTRDRLLSAAIECLESDGEQSIKLAKIAEVVGISEPAIYSHFANRRELVVAAYKEWYRRSLVTPMSPTSTTDELTDLESYLARLRAYIRSSFEPGREAARAARVTVIGAAQRDPDLQRAVNEANREFLSVVEGVVRTAQQNGWCRTDIEARAIAYWVNGMMTGRILAEMDPEQVNMTHWDQVAEDSVLALLP